MGGGAAAETGLSAVDGRTRRWEHRRPELLRAASAYVLEHGVATLTLRPLADALGISVASVIRHFGSKDQLVEEVCLGILRSQMGRVREDPLLASASPIEQFRRLWAVWLEPKERQQWELFVELHGLAVRDPQRYLWFTESTIHDWIAPLARTLVEMGRSPEEAHRVSRLVLATLRGLHLDLAATDEVQAVTAAFDLALEILTPHLT